MTQLRPSTLPALLAAGAETAPSRIAVAAVDGVTVSYSELWRRVCGVGAALRAAGVGPADRVATVVASGPEAALALVGVASHAVCAPIDSAATAADVERACADLRVGLVVCDRALRSPAAEAACRAGVPTIDVSSLPGDDAAVAEMPGSGDDAFLLTTSGTTSRPKFARITHGNLCAAAANTRRHLQLTAEDRCLNVMPLSHGSGLSTGLIASLTAGASVVCAPRFDPALMIEWLEEVGPTWYAAVPAMHQALLSALARDPKPVRVPSLRLVRSSGMALPPAVLTGLERVFRAPVIEAYGMVGAGTIAGTSLPPGVRKPGSVGMPVGPEVAIIGEDDKELAPGQRGAIVVRGPTVTPGYVGEASAAEAAFTENGWFRTGDEGFLDGDGYLTICGRLKDVINRGGEKVSPVEVDEVLLEHPDVAEAAAFAVPHGTLGEEVAAAVVLRRGAETTEGELQAFAAGRLAAFKVPRRIVIVDEVPKGRFGKLQRRVLAETLHAEASHPAGKTSLSRRAPLEAALAGVWAELLDVERVEVDQNFFMLGGDSLVAAQLISAVGEVWGVEIPVQSLLAEAATVGRMAAVIERSRHAAGARPARARLFDVQPNALFKVQPTGSRPPLFVVEPSLVLMHHLVPRVGPQQPVFGLVMAPVDENPAAFETLESIAAFHLSTIRSVQPEGPYFLAGHCFAGLVAFEIGQQLRSAGKEVGLVALLDVPGPAARAVDAAHSAKHASRLAAGYAAREFRSPVALVRTRATADRKGDPRLGWGGLLAGPLQVHEVEGDHDSMQRDPHASGLADVLASCLEAAQSTAATPAHP